MYLEARVSKGLLRRGLAVVRGVSAQEGVLGASKSGAHEPRRNTQASFCRSTSAPYLSDTGFLNAPFTHFPPFTFHVFPLLSSHSFLCEKGFLWEHCHCFVCKPGGFGSMFT